MRTAPPPPAATVLTRDAADALRLRAHLGKRLLIRIEVKLRDEPKPAYESQRVLREAVRRHRAQDAALEVFAPVVRVDDRPVGETACDRVDREITPVEIVFDRCGRVDDDLEVVTAGPRRDLPARRRKLDPRTHLFPQLRVARVEADAYGPSRDDQLLGASMRLERGAQAFDVDAGNEEVGVLRLVPE